MALTIPTGDELAQEIQLPDAPAAIERLQEWGYVSVETDPDQA